MNFFKRIELAIESVLFASRWLLAPFFLALAFSLFVLLFKAAQHTLHLLEGALTSTETAVVLDVLSLIDICLTGSLVVLVIFSGYENFVCRTDPERYALRPEWMTAIDFSGLKIKLLSSIVAITAIQTLRDYMDLDNRPDRSLAWSVGVHLSFVVSTLLLTLSDRIGGHAAAKGNGH